MKIISKANEAVQNILKNIKRTGVRKHLSQFCIELSVDDGIMLFNLLTRELVFLSQEEYRHLHEMTYLKEHWFLVPDDAQEKEYVDFVRWVFATKKRKTNKITNYTIFPTTDCNARCFYCFELGRSRISMDKETAQKVVKYIKNHSGGEKVKLTWFGGEPLCNMEAIDSICEGLTYEGISFDSSFVSNGYLFDKETVQKAVDQWSLKRVQITLDGTETVYNKVKAFVYKEGNPYQTVMQNIKYLLDKDVLVYIRLNFDLHNADNLLELASELAERFEKRHNIFVQTKHIFEIGKNWAEIHSEETWRTLTETMKRLDNNLAEAGFVKGYGIKKDVKLNCCMADSGSAVTILPDGHIGLCERCSEDEFIGHIDQEGFDEAVVASWKKRVPEIPECAKCFYYPECWILNKCAAGRTCGTRERNEKLRKTQKAMLAEYERWKNQTATEEVVEPVDC